MSLHLPRRILTGGFAIAALVLGAGTASAGPAFAQTSLTPVSSGNTINTVAGDGHRGHAGNGGPAVSAELDNPEGVAADLSGTLYIADTGANRVDKVVDPTTLGSDIITTIAGNGMAGFSGDHGQGVLAKLSHPQGVAVDNQGDVFVADTGNNRIREILPDGTITTFAGNGSCGYFHGHGRHKDSALGNGGPASEASLCSPTGVAVDTSGNVYIADAGHHVVRLVNSRGVISTLAGTGQVGRGGDGGPTTQAELGYPVTVAVNALKDVYIADAFENDVREVNQAGIVSTVLGRGPAGFRDGRPSKTDLSQPSGLGVDDTGDVFIGDTGHNRILELTAGGQISEYAGTGRPGFSGDLGAATKARLLYPQGSFAINPDALFFADTGNQRVRGVFSGPPPVLPETAAPVLLVIGAAVIFLAAGLITYRRRRRHLISAR